MVLKDLTIKQPRTITLKFWLRFNRRGKVTASKRAPAMSVDERCMQCSLVVPEALFSRPSLRAEITVPDFDFEIPYIQAEAAEKAISEILDMTVAMTVVPPTQGTSNE